MFHHGLPHAGFENKRKHEILVPDPPGKAVSILLLFSCSVSSLSPSFEGKE
jgi:hypothetical protein